MALTPSVIRSAMAAAAAALDAVCVDIEHEARTGRGSSGAPTYAAAVTRRGGVTRKPRILRSQDGTEIVSAVELGFPAPFAVAVGDRFTVGGEALTAIQVEYVTDAETGLPYASIVYC